MKHDARIALGLTAVSLLIALSAATGEARFVKPPSWTTNPSIVLDPDVPPPPPQPTPVPQIATPGIDIVERKGTSLTIEWCDRSGADNGHALFRGTTPETADDTVVATLNSQALGCYRYENTGLLPDTNYCFRVAPKQFGSIFIDYISRTVCAYTREAQSRPVWRVELEVRTSNTSNADTEDKVRVRLNTPPTPPIYSDLPTYYPGGNVTWLDYGRDDFERGAAQSYDLNMNGITEFGDIHRIDFAIDGSDMWCISGFALYVNGVKVYNESHNPCLKSEDWGSYQTIFHSVSHDRLRASPLWQKYKTPKLVDAQQALAALSAGESVDVLTIRRQELESRIEGTVGHGLVFNKLEWGDLQGTRHVEAIATADPQVAHIDLDLEAEVPVLNNPAVDVDLDLRFAMACRADGTGIDFQFDTENFTVDADSSLFTQFVGYLFCAYDTQCTPGLLSYIENQVRSGFQPLARTISIQSAEAVGACALGYLPTVAVTDEGDVVISIEPGSSPPSPSPTPTRTPNPYGPVKDGFLKPTRGLLRR